MLLLGKGVEYQESKGRSEGWNCTTSESKIP